VSVGPDEAGLRRLVDDARAVVAAVGALGGEASYPDDVAWAAERAAGAHDCLLRLERVLRAGDARGFPGALLAVEMQMRPVEDAPPALQPATTAVQAAANRLAVDLRRVVDPHLDPDGFLPVEVGRTLRRIASG